ncbi:MAG: imidazolonepropionase [Defluviitaleaceae bacterium]|nr:imidazolonepropionase [Defluviitaleaceae bacterium]
MADLLIKNIGVLASPKGQAPLKGADMSNITIAENCVIAAEKGIITYIGTEKDAPKSKEVLDAGGRLITPGLVDAHTHLVFGGWRQHEFELKLKGAAYLDILKAGGGILSTVEKTRAATEDELFNKAKDISLKMAKHGTTTIEAKSGYGLNLEDELKQLKVVKRLNNETDLDFVSTFMGAHAVPPEYKGRSEDYIDFICNEVMPIAAAEKLADFCDIFCETGVFDAILSEKLLLKARELGLKLKIHADEINPVGGSELAGRMKCHSAEHLIAATDEGIDLCAKGGVIAVLLPATSFYLDKPYARARYMMDKGIAVAVASDFNPGSSPNFNMQFPMNLACLKYKMTPKEALSAVTLNAAAAIGMADKIGSIEIRKKADIVIWDAPDLDYLFYRYGNNQALYTIKNGGIL